MTNPLSHRERIRAAISGQTPDRAPVALWRHFPVDDQDPEKLAAATIAWQKAYDWDLVKVTPASSFCIKDWGVDDVWEGHTEGTRRYTRRVVTTPEDWLKLPQLDPSALHLASQLKSLSIIRAGLPPETPVIQTIFSPLAQAKNLAGGENLLIHIRQQPEMVKHGLHVIAESTRKFIHAALQTGIDGIFYAVQHAQAGLLTETEFADFGVAFDLPVLEASAPGWLNLLHLHGENVYFHLVADYPVQVINWHDRSTPPNLAEGLQRTRAAACGGISQDTLVYRNAAAVADEAAEALAQTNGRRFILGTGCVVPVIASHGNLMTARNIVELP